MSAIIRCMGQDQLEAWAHKAVADAALERTASQLRGILKELAGRLDPFPDFMNISSIQAVEVEPDGLQSRDRGCVVVCPDGELYELSLQVIPGPLGVSDADQVEEFQPLDIPPQEYIPYAYAAIVALAERMDSTSRPL